ncbi:MAG: hypothetical protein GY757_08295, partial [bacterium]|nr:hypothetical protein [bacterium]
VMEPEELDETAPLPSESDLTPPPPPMASQPSPPPQAGAIGQRPPKPVATPSAAGFLFKGLLLGVPIALCMNYAILLLAAFSKAPKGTGAKFTQLLQAILGAFPIVHLHKNWTSTPQWDVSTVFIAVGIPVGLILGGLICQKFACRNRLVAAALFSLIYVALAVLLQLVALEFNMIAWKFIYAAAGINTGQEAMNVVVNILYFYGVTFIFSFLGTLFGKSK